MKEKKVIPSPHVLDEENLKFRFVGREDAIKQTSKSFANIIRTVESGFPDCNRPEFPVCAGISGLGKTRMLEEGGMILRDVMKLDAKLVSSVIVPYSNEYSPQPVEATLPIEASFSWRLLYRFFLANNCSYSFDEWFMSRLPVNACHLTFGKAVRTIECKLRKKQQDTTKLLHLFLGIDDYYYNIK